MGDMANSADIDGGLPAHDLWGVGGEGGDVFIVLRFEFIVLGIEFVDLFFGESDDVFHQFKVKIINFLRSIFSFIF